MIARSEFRRGVAALCLLALFAAPACAADESTPALPMRGGTAVTILRVDGSRENARLVALAANPPRLLLADSNARRWGGGGWSRELPLAQIAAIEAPGSAKFRGRRIFVGVAVGMLAGGLLGFAFAPDPPRGAQIFDPAGWYGNPGGTPGRMESAALGMASGAIVGTIVGLLAAPTTGPVRRWAFTEAGEAVPDSSQLPIR